MSDDIKINLGDGTSLPSVEGAGAILALADHRFNKNGDLILRYRFEAAGDDALHAGNVEVKVKVNRPDNSNPGDGKTTSEANAIGAQYALGMVEVARRVLSGSLVEDFTEAVKAAVSPEATEDREEALARTCWNIATMLLVQNGHDTEKAKEASKLIVSDEWIAKAGAYGLAREDVEQGREMILSAIDHIQSGQA